jgi:hypothetical protein
MERSQQLAKLWRDRVAVGWLDENARLRLEGCRVCASPSSNRGVKGRDATTKITPKNHQGWRWLFTTDVKR